MLQLIDIRKSYKTFDFTQTALDGVSIAFRHNEFAAVLGPSGSGKTTMLNIIGGLDHYDSGDLEIDGISTKKYKSSDWDTYRNNRIGFVFQSYNLIPHQTVLANVELALTLSGVSKTERTERAKEALKQVGLEDHVRKKPNQLSGGQMQRVAIARALINDPEILLADEPTGALDTQTSKQVMDLLTEIAKDRLVIMVTHNPELAEEYANRIIHLKDGQVTSDSNPFNPTEEEKREGREPRKASMSFLTALSLSFSNLMTKKGRTFVTALAGSIGIIGIAAILALANGINDYIQTIEQETMSIYPLTIQSSGFDLSSMIVDTDGPTQNTTGGIQERDVVESLFSYRRKNDLTTLKEYLDTNQDLISPYVHTIQYSYDITPQIYLPDTSNGVDQVHPDSILGAYGFGSSSGMGSLMSSFSGMSTGMEVFHEMPNNYDMFEYQYDILTGNWPQNYNEVVLVLSSNGTITDYELYSMGLKDRAELKTIVEAFMNNTDADITIDEENIELSYESLMAVEFKVVNPAEQYQYDEMYHVWVDKSGDKSYMSSLVENGLTLKIVGIVQPKEGITATTLSSGINYTPELIRYLMEEAAKTKIVQEQLANPTINVLTGRTFIEENEESTQAEFNFSDIITIDQNAIKNAFKVDSSKINIDLSGLNNLSIDMSGVSSPEFDIMEMITSVANQVNIPADEIIAIMGSVLEDFLAEEASNGVTDPEQMLTDLPTYLAREDVQASISAQLSQVIDPTELESQINTGLQNYMSTVMQAYMSQVVGTLQSQIQSQLQQVLEGAMGQLPTQLQSAISIDTNAFANAFQLNMTQEELLDLMKSLMNTEESTYEQNLTLLGYADTELPSQISIYPLDFNSKKEVQTFLEQYNETMKANGDGDKAVSYTDLVGVMMSSVTDIVNMVSYALIAFVAISLVVSSIMIGVITYISVLERKKEIGILRALGASKKNIRQVFNAETLIVGFVAGMLGIVVTFLICSVANVIVYTEFGIANIAQLSIEAAGVLIGVSMFLTFIAGLLPSSAAARKDPVEALRSE